MNKNKHEKLITDANVSHCVTMRTEPRPLCSVAAADSPSMEPEIVGATVGNLSGGVEDLVGAKPTGQRRHAVLTLGNSAKSGYADSGSSAPPAQSPLASEEVGRYRFINEGGKHLHTLDGAPLIGTSTAVQVIGKGGLTWWSAELAAVECLESGQHIPTIREEYEAVCALAGKDRKNARDRLQRKYPIFKKARYAHKEKKESAATPGTNMHAALQRYVEDCIYEHHGKPVTHVAYEDSAVEIFAEWAEANVAEFLWSEGHCYSERLWVGGICDCGAVLQDRNVAVIDFKSSREAYPGHFIQAAGYAIQISENGILSANGGQVMGPAQASQLVVFPFGSDIGPQTEEAPRLQRAFEAAVVIHNTLKVFESY